MEELRGASAAGGDGGGTSGIKLVPPTPAGLETLYALCRQIYPNQVNPLQVTALLKYWLGGPDPLDYISMYACTGDPNQNVPQHWHYISFGLSDLHGDGRVHEINTEPQGPSGFGFELTFRLKRERGETAPPTWPAALMQSLAKYVFHSGNNLCAGDHVSWHCALDNSESRIQHMLMAKDPQLPTTTTPYGTVEFVQIVGVCADELQAAQQWNGVGVLEMLSRASSAGGPWLVTDMRRGESIFELDPSAHEDVERGFETEGSNLSGVSARCSWCEYDVKNKPHISEEESDQIRQTLQRGLRTIGGSNPDESTELMRTRKLDGVHLTFNLEAGSLLPLAIRGRVKHGRHFTFKSVGGETAITLVASTVTETLVDPEQPYVAHGPWLQLLIPDELAHDMAMTFETLTKHQDTLQLPKTFTWPERKLQVTIVADQI